MANLPTTMHGVQLTAHGDFDALKYATDIAVPSLASTDVLIKVMAAGVNNTDLNTRLAWYSKKGDESDDASWSGNALVFPRIQGADVCGVIIAVGESVDKNRIGERILVEPCLLKANGESLKTPWYFGSECDGGFAQYTVVDSLHAYKINSSYSDVELASFPCSYSTAENMLYRSNPQQGQTVLITGASGGVGSAAVQLAKARGANVIAITSESKAQQLKGLGADKVLSREDDLIKTLGKSSVDVVIDLVAGEQWPKLLEVLKPKGRYAVSGAIGGALVELDIRTLYLKDLTFFGCTVIEPGVFKSLVNFIEQEKIKPIVAQTLPLSEIVTAQQVFSQKLHVGKIVLTIPHSE